ncbi:response regulator [Flammeovirgaceae bacterium SG7u.111]|nr:response regulator [Flammeovirgaceae bacterium SG7u.132]WPO35462.1 response regulator [Flammeovirgaceae bacterium SG7u.111]
MKEKKYNILYVDDEESNLRIFRAAFKQYYNIFLAVNAAEGLEVLQKNEIHLIITDQRMPKMTGVEFLEKVIDDYPDPIRIILTGFSDIEDIIRALNKCSIYRYIVKPWNREEMKLTIDKALEAFQLRRDNSSLVNELKGINNSLEEKIKDRTGELIEANKMMLQAKEKAEHASKAKEIFLSTMSHEIRTPLNAIIGISHLLAKSELTAEQTENVEILEFSAKSLLSLINDILDLSKIEAGKIELEKIEFNLLTLMKGIYKSLAPRADEKKLLFDIELDDELPEVLLGDQVRLGQILNNLLSNAIKFTESGTVTLSAKVQALEDNKATILFSVKDTGIGIQDELREKIFEDFSQASSDTTRKFGGTGLGLSITKRLVTMLGGTIELESIMGQGSEFKCVITFETSAVTEQELNGEDKNLQVRDLKGLKVLVVEDNKFNRTIAKKFLSNWNATIDFAFNGLEAVEKMQADTSYQFILMDIQMPEMDGFQATEAIRQLSGDYYKNLPIIALTASTLPGEREKVLAAGMDDFIMKPFNPDTLYDTIVKFSEGRNGLKPSQGEDSPPSVSVPESPERLQINFERFKKMTENDNAFYMELLDMTVEDYEMFKDDFRGAFLSSDFKAMSELSHKIRPSMIVMGMAWLDEEVISLRQMLKEGKLDHVSVLEKRVFEGLDFALQNLKSEAEVVRKML